MVETSEGAVIKRLTLSEGDRYVTAESINPDYAPYRIPRADIRSLWRVLCHVVYQEPHQKPMEILKILFGIVCIAEVVAFLRRYI